MSIPDYEFKQRLEKVKELLNKNNLDFLLIYFDEYNVMNGRYLTGWCPTIERGAVIISNYCEPFLIGGPEAGPYAEMDSHIKKTVSSLVFMVPEEEYPMASIYNFKKISDMYFGGREIKKIGLVDKNTIPFQIYEQIDNESGDAEIIDLTYDYEKLRYVKSEWEFEMIAKAYEIADVSFKALMENIVEGNKEYQAAAEAEYLHRKMGGEGLGYRTIIGTAERSIGIVPPASDRIFKNGEIVLAGFAPRYNGYNATACYPIVVGGKPDNLQKKFVEDVTEALHLTREALKPGMVGMEIDNIPRNFLIKKGYSDYLPMPFVHSSGLGEFEKPFFGPNSDDVLQKNQAICIDITIFGHEKIPGIRVETGYKMTKDGAVTFSEFMEKLFGF